MSKGMGLMKSKAEDYTEKEASRYQNFERQAEIISWFNNSIDQAFAGLIAVKLARLASLLNRETTPNHESIEDTFVDLTNYAALWAGNRSEIKEPGKSEVPEDDSTRVRECKRCGVKFLTSSPLFVTLYSHTADHIKYFFCTPAHREDYIKEITRGAYYFNKVDNTIAPY